MNNKNTVMTWKIPKAEKLSPRDKDQTNALLYNEENGLKQQET